MEVSRVARVRHLERQMVVYSKLPGKPLRHALRESSSDEGRDLIGRFGGFFAKVHDLGVFFRSFHEGYSSAATSRDPAQAEPTKELLQREFLELNATR